MASFYLWGQSYEFDQNLPNNNWGIIEEFAPGETIELKEK